MRTHKQQWNLRHGFPQSASHSLEEIARFSNIQRKYLKMVYDRGVGAHATNPASVRLRGTFKKAPHVPISQKLSAEQWGMARVYAFVNKIESRLKLDHDLNLLKKVQTLAGSFTL